MEQVSFPFAWQPEINPETPDLNEPVFLFDPRAQEGLRPTRACAERLLWFQQSRLPELMESVERGWTERAHYDSAVLNNPTRIVEMQKQYLDALQWELSRYGSAAVTMRKARVAA